MNKPVRSSKWFVITGVFLTGALLLLAFFLAYLRGLSNRERLPVYGQVAEFTLTNEFGAPVSLADLQGKVWVADIIFTRCPGPCLRMGKQMKELQQALPAGSPVQLISLTADADYDTPPVLKTYAVRYGFADNTNQWQFLTGTKKQIVNLAVNSLKFVAVEKTPGPGEVPEDLFIHSTSFALVDKHGKFRGVFETGGEGVDFQQTKAKLLSAIRQLEHEP
jgi:protein SCO1/2